MSAAAARHIAHSFGGVSSRPCAVPEAAKDTACQAKGGNAGPAVVGWRTIVSADSGRARDPAAGAEAPRRAGFRFTRPSLR